MCNSRSKNISKLLMKESTLHLKHLNAKKCLMYALRQDCIHNEMSFCYRYKIFVNAIFLYNIAHITNIKIKWL